MYISLLIKVLFLLFVCNACEETQTPKPKGYPRVVFPGKPIYESLNGLYPYSFEYSKYAEIQQIRTEDSGTDSHWLNIHYPDLKATLFLSHKQFKKLEELNTFVEDAHSLTYKHIVRASAIEEATINKTEDHVYGLMYRIAGNAASPLQFYLTDSTQNFVRISLYFETSPNADSLAPYLGYVQNDVLHLIDTFHWK